MTRWSVRTFRQNREDEKTGNYEYLGVWPKIRAQRGGGVKGEGGKMEFDIIDQTDPREPQ